MKKEYAVYDRFVMVYEDGLRITQFNCDPPFERTIEQITYVLRALGYEKVEPKKIVRSSE
ncbi:hypothetical protein [Glutamicibacter sp.]|jgi:hypothetical protein|uniref:hypothetical protein n=1 Tax=Glutamicibacter sp. TaxID=1931995 RepID=UPI002B4764BA|nr:hypothetical protein [Glutamicibacter sp.]HJX79193.1 hypothetical protein [Glutamicibacter sp.]